MNNDIISSIYSAYLDNAFKGIQALASDDLKVAYANLEEFEKKHNISLSEHNDLDMDIITKFTYISELKGFTNGFKLAIQLIFEAYGITK